MKLLEKLFVYVVLGGFCALLALFILKLVFFGMFGDVSPYE